MYSDDIEFCSPKIRVVLPEKIEDKVNGKKELKYYWILATRKFKDLHFTPIGFTLNGGGDDDYNGASKVDNILDDNSSSNTGNDDCIECFFEYIAKLNDTKSLVIEKFRFSSDKISVRTSAFYGAAIKNE